MFSESGGPTEWGGPGVAEAKGGGIGRVVVREAARVLRLAQTDGRTGSSSPSDGSSRSGPTPRS